MSKKLTLSSNSVLSLIAPTASGKTVLAYQIYDTNKFELISVDSALIYKDMNIGTAKPTAEELLKYPHHLVDIINPTENYSVANFVSDIKNLIEDIQSRNKIPLLVGGTMMYYMALFDGISPIPNSDTEIRQEVDNWRQAEGIADLHRYLQIHDPIIAERLHISDTQRITRAVEVHKQTGKAMSEWQKLPKNALAQTDNNHWQIFSVMPDRAWLHQRIERRLEMMWQAGFTKEVIDLIDNYQLSADMPSMRCVGYRQVIDYLLIQKYVEKNKEIFTLNFNKNINNTQEMANYLHNFADETCQDMKNKALYATRQLAKRQCTWLKKLNKMDNFSSIDIEIFASTEQIKAKLI
ncbi:MAG: tRNA (adenosine(37)-N6)-dimethylallyltransferase MiaA [Moraxellaceae bacterium]|nr:tRNA (adenosine(37)-N6)-dimethylallyltransferase MiaA [Moraxellaceae bacterium]